MQLRTLAEWTNKKKENSLDFTLFQNNFATGIWVEMICKMIRMIRTWSDTSLILTRIMNFSCDEFCSLKVTFQGIRPQHGERAK